MLPRKLFSSVCKLDQKTFKLIANTQNELHFHSSISAKFPVEAKANSDEQTGKIPFMEYDKSRQGDKRVYVWGLAAHGALGYILNVQRKRSARRYFHNPIRLHFAYDHPVSQVACGYGFTVLGISSTDQRKVFGCGINSDGQIGYHDVRKDHPLGILLQPVPINIPFKDPSKAKILSVDAGRAHTAIVSTEGTFLLGNNAYGQCGRAIVKDEEHVMLKVPTPPCTSLGDEAIVSVCCGQDHSLFLTESGRVYGCGWGADGQTGLGHYENEWKPSLVRGDIENEKIIKLSCASDCVLALNDKGEVFGWGNSEYGQLFNPDGLQQINKPLYLSRTKHLGKIIDIASAGTNCAVLTEEGKVFVWGFGILGNGPKVFRNEYPTVIPPPLFGCNELQPKSRVVKIEAGLAQFAAVTNYGSLYMWGRNHCGQLGLGHILDQFFPLQIAIGGLVKDIKLGVDHTVAIAEPFI